MKEISLTKGMSAIVDDDMFEMISQWKWIYSPTGYATRNYFNKEKYKLYTKKERWKANECIYMHRLINNTKDGYLTDHINGNKLDNRKCNLRTATKQLNAINSKLDIRNQSGTRGVSWYKNAWVAGISSNGKQYYLGRFKNKEDAITARKNAEKTIWKI